MKSKITNIHTVKEEIESISLPILFEDGRQLQIVKDGFLVGSYDPVEELKIVGDILKIKGSKYEYSHNLNEFDRIVVEEFELDENRDRIHKKTDYKYK